MVESLAICDFGVRIQNSDTSFTNKLFNQSTIINDLNLSREIPFRDERSEFHWDEPNDPNEHNHHNQRGGKHGNRNQNRKNI